LLSRIRSIENTAVAVPLDYTLIFLVLLYGTFLKSILLKESFEKFSHRLFRDIDMVDGIGGRCFRLCLVYGMCVELPIIAKDAVCGLIGVAARWWIKDFRTHRGTRRGCVTYCIVEGSYVE
jgi:hypothetical protein